MSSTDTSHRNGFDRRDVLKLAGAVAGTSVLAGCAAQLDTAGERLAELGDEVETPLLDPESVRWRTAYGLTDTELATHDDEAHGDGLMMMAIDAHYTSDQGRTNRYAIWHQNIWHVDVPDGQDREAHWDLTTQEFEDLVDQYSADGYRLADQAHYYHRDVGGLERRHAGIWVHNQGDLTWHWNWDEPIPDADANRDDRRSPSLDDFMQTSTDTTTTDTEDADTADDVALMPLSLECYHIDRDPHYASIWVENTDAVEWTWDLDLAFADMDRTFKERRGAGLRPLDITAYRHDDAVKFGVIWVENTPRKPYQGPQDEPNDGQLYDGTRWHLTRELTTPQLEHEREAMFDRGFRPIAHAAYHRDEPDGRSVRHAVVWRQNSMRPQWHGRAQADAILQDFIHEDQNNLPSISAAIIEDGVVLYRRAFGYREESTNTPADSRTRYRLASVSKPMGSIIGFRLEEAGEIDLWTRTRDYLPDLGEDHEHRLVDLISHQSCMPHYGTATTREYQHFDTAMEAAEHFEYWNDEILETTADSGSLELADGRDECFPASGYRYSTAGYTLLGAAYEEATGLSVSELVQAVLSDPFEVDSLRAEDRRVPDPRRARLYDHQDDSASVTDDYEELKEPPVEGDKDDYVDDISWKVLGGGLEATAVDIARVGYLFLDGQIVSNANRELMWDVVDTDLDTTRTYGWNTGTHWTGSEMIWHTGNQQGGNSAIVIFPEENISMALMANRQKVNGDTAIQAANQLINNINLI